MKEEFRTTANFIIVKTAYGNGRSRSGNLYKAVRFLLHTLSPPAIPNKSGMTEGLSNEDFGLDLCIISIEGCEKQKRFFR